MLNLMEQVLGKIIDDRYQVTGILGEGGFGWVYKTRDLVSHNVVAIKVLRPEILDDSCLARFEREAQVLSLLDHPNICRFIGFGWHEELPYLAMEYVDGMPLYTFDQKLSTAEVVSLAIQICDALAQAHARGIVHRDLKPTNILVMSQAPGRHVKLLDFGLSKLIGVQQQKLTNTGFFIGSVNYASPEQCLGMTVDARADIYSLGCVLYQLVCGEAPFAGDAELAVMHKQVYDTARPLAESSDEETKRLVKCIEIAMQKAPDARFQDAAAMRAALLNERCTAGFFSMLRTVRNTLKTNALLSETALAPAIVACAMVGVAAITAVVMHVHRLDQRHSGNPRKNAPQVASATDVIKTVRRELKNGNYIQAQSSIEALLSTLHKSNSRSREEIEATVVYGEILQARSQYAESLDAFLTASKLAAQTLSVDDPLRDWAYSKLGNSYTLNERCGEAIACLSNNLQAREKNYGRNSWQTAETRYCLADAYTKQGELVAAGDQFKRAYEIYKATVGASDPRTVAALGSYENIVARLHSSSR